MNVNPNARASGVNTASGPAGGGSTGKARDSATGQNTTGLEQRAATTAAVRQPTLSVLAFPSDLMLHDRFQQGEVHGLRAYGHVAVWDKQSKTAYGFGPETGPHNAAQVADTLMSEGAYPGKVTDDTHVFHDVRQNPVIEGSGIAQQVYEVKVPMSHAQRDRIRAQLQDMKDQPMAHLPYAFPFPGVDAHNCATFPQTLGMALPYTAVRSDGKLDGSLRVVIPKMAEKGRPWNPDSPVTP